jgi:3-oxoacyl-[acyl-carrier protein] reductase
MKPRTAIVTGASSGIGAAIAATFARHGVQVVGCARRATIDGGTIPGLQMVSHDLTDATQVEALFDEARRVLGDIDTVVHSVGHEYPIALLADADLRAIPRAIDALVTSPALVVSAALRNVAEGRPSRIFVVSSGAALRPLPGRSVYSAAKACVNQLVRSAASEVGTGDIAVTAIMPGRVDTPMQRRLVETAQTADASLGLEEFRSLDGVSQPLDVAAAVWDLAMRPTVDLNGAILRYRDGEFRPIA